MQIQPSSDARARAPDKTEGAAKLGVGKFKVTAIRPADSPRLEARGDVGHDVGGARKTPGEIK